MVPMISTPEEAQQVVRASKFPPMGVRGQGSPFSCWSHGITTAEYVQTANERLLTLVQIENAEGTRNAESIAAVEGVGEFGDNGKGGTAEHQTHCSSGPTTCIWRYSAPLPPTLTRSRFWRCWTGSSPRVSGHRSRLGYSCRMGRRRSGRGSDGGAT